ncbi:hypothetical protein ACT3UD_10190 [Glutamicibacter sp. 287]|uniref:hypothetical protein n=1 Tax=Glutamicibacter sp. 287 TaxID=3457732 RepID=UPI00403322EA
MSNAGRPVQGQSLMVLGLGGVGMAALLVAIAHTAGWKRPARLIAVDMNREKLRRALELGATEALTLIGSYLGSAVPARDIPYYEQLWRDGLLPVEELLTGQRPLSEINLAFDELADGSSIRQLIAFD